MTELIGRTTDVQRVTDRIEAGTRVLTLWGPAGVGKTQLARACAAASTTCRTTWFVDLSTAVDWGGVASAVSRALRIELQLTTEEGVVDQLGRALAARGRVLVVLDNFEQVISSAAQQVAAWSAVATEATFLITSREPLGLGCEVLYEVPSLTSDAACELFIRRVECAGRSVRREDTPLVAQIVGQLDGLPLAVELAAAQVPFLGFPELRSRLTRLELYESGRLDVHDRQRTLCGALEWSWRLLSPGEQRTLAQCSVFRGGFTLAAAEATLMGEPPAGAMSVLRALHRRALVQAKVLDGGEVRYGLLFAVREFAAGYLVRGTTPTADEIRGRHAAYYAAAAERWAAEAGRSGGCDGLALLALERDNLLAAHAHVAGHDPALAMRIALALEPLLLAHGPIDVLARLIDEAMPSVGDLDPTLRGWALRARALATRRLGDSCAAIADFDGALEVARRTADSRLQASVLCERGWWIAEQGRCPAAIEQLEAALALAVEVGDRAIEAEVLTNLGYTMWYDGKLSAAEALYRRALPLAQASANVSLQARIVAHMASLAYERGDLVNFGAESHTARELARGAGDLRHVAKLTMSLALCAAEQGRILDADRLFAESLKGLREAGDVVGEGHCLANVGWEEMRYGRGQGRAELERALALLDDAQIGWAGGLVRATLAGIAATEDRIDDARELIAQAERCMQTVTDPRLHDAARLHYAHLDLALARRAEALGDAVAAERHRASVRALIEREPTDLDSGRSDARLARLVLERALDRIPPCRAGAGPRLPDEALLIARGAVAFRPPGGAWVDLSRRASLRRILQALATSGEHSTTDLLRAAWPDEYVSAQAGAARVHVAIGTLRRLGLGPMLRRSATGYYLDREVSIVTEIHVVMQAMTPA